MSKYYSLIHINRVHISKKKEPGAGNNISKRCLKLETETQHLDIIPYFCTLIKY